jgi:hypothetical protein
MRLCRINSSFVGDSMRYFDNEWSVRHIMHSPTQLLQPDNKPSPPTGLKREERHSSFADGFSWRGPRPGDDFVFIIVHFV